MVHRNRIAGSIAAVLLVAAAAPSLAQPAAQKQAAPAKAQAQTPQSNPNRRVCVRADSTGTRLSQLECRTEREWMRTEGFVPGRER